MEITESRREKVRLTRRHGWVRCAIAKERDTPCYIVLVELKAFGDLKTARKAMLEWLDTQFPVAKKEKR